MTIPRTTAACRAPNQCPKNCSQRLLGHLAAQSPDRSEGDEAHHQNHVADECSFCDEDKDAEKYGEDNESREHYPARRSLGHGPSLVAGRQVNAAGRESCDAISGGLGNGWSRERKTSGRRVSSMLAGKG